VLTAGSGMTVGNESTVQINYVGIDARTGKAFDSSFSRGAPASFPLTQVIPGFQKGLAGHKVGDRVLVMMPGTDAYDSQGGNPQAGILTGDSLIFVVDILSASYPTATGTAVAPAAGLPTVTVKNNVPTVTIGNATKPTALVAQTLIKGNGPKVTATDQLQVHYRSWAWSNGKMIEDGFAGPGVTGQMSAVVEGWKKGLVGQTCGLPGDAHRAAGDGLSRRQRDPVHRQERDPGLRRRHPVRRSRLLISALTDEGRGVRSGSQHPTTSRSAR
jgi:peptidylprolyl isomerase